MTDRHPPSPQILAEIPAPSWARAAQLCPVVHGSPRLVWAEGSTTAPLGIILDNPGRREQPDGTPVVCPTRRVLQRALWEAGITLDQVQVLFLFKCRPVGAYQRPEAYRTFVPILEDQIRQGNCVGLIGLGNTVAQGLLGPGAEVRRLRGHVLRWANRPLCLGDHPLAVWRQPALAQRLADDLERAGRQCGLVAMP